MHGITNIVAHLTSPPQGAGTNAPSGQSSGSGFQIATLVRPLNALSAQGVSTTASPSLGSQTVSTLLQTQDLSQTQAPGAGGGHHGGMKMMPGLEAEEAAEDEETQLLRQRNKLTKTVKPSDASELVEVDENGVPLMTNVEQCETDLPNKEDGLHSGT